MAGIKSPLLPAGTRLGYFAGPGDKRLDILGACTVLKYDRFSFIIGIYILLLGVSNYHELFEEFENKK